MKKILLLLIAFWCFGLSIKAQNKTGGITEYNNINLRYSSVSLSVDNWMFLNIGDMTAYSAEQANSTIGDFGFNVSGGLFNCVSPNASFITTVYSYNSISYSTVGKRNTLFEPSNLIWNNITSSDFIDFTTSSYLLSSPTYGNGISSIANGNIIKFKTQDGIIGFIQVVSGAKLVKDIIINVKLLAPYDVTFYITNPNTGSPVSNATVNVDSQTLTTNSSGLVTTQLDNGYYEYSVSADGYNTFYDNLTVNGTSIVENVFLQPAVYNVSFTVNNNSTLQPIPNSKIYINSEILTTNSDGQATIALSDGIYNYTVSANGFNNFLIA